MVHCETDAGFLCVLSLKKTKSGAGVHHEGYYSFVEISIRTQSGSAVHGMHVKEYIFVKLMVLSFTT